MEHAICMVCCKFLQVLVYCEIGVLITGEVTDQYQPTTDGKIFDTSVTVEPL